ncbi:MAG TPA: hypothetical protein VM431_02090 [Phycisphaerae bacterium]|nr:hypothetical protein [Phycisphaerae bacterium]
MLYVTIHGVWMIVAVVVGTVAGYLGLLRATQGEGGRSPLPGRFRMKLHTGLGLVYYLMLYAGLAGGVVMVRFLLPSDVLPRSIAKVHVVLAVLVGTLYGVAWLIGRRLEQKPAGAARLLPRLHMVFNFTACTLIGIQIALAAYYVWIWPNL